MPHKTTAEIMVVEDDGSQREALSILLSRFGNVRTFEDPRPALDYALANRVDAIVLDVRMPAYDVDGIWFIKELRKHDPLVGVILRTGDSDISIAQAGIESRAMQRIIKGDRNSVELLKSGVVAAIEETAQRRKLAESGQQAEMAREQMYSALRKIDSDSAAVDLCLGFTRELSPKIFALHGYANRLRELTSDRRDKKIQDVATKALETSDAVRKMLSDFVSSPFFSDKGLGRTPTCSAVTEALIQSFAADPLFAGKNILNIIGSSPDAGVGNDPKQVLAILRHIVGYCQSRLEPNTNISAHWSQCRSPAELQQEKQSSLPLSKGATPGLPCLTFTVSANIGSLPLPELEGIAHEIPAIDQPHNLASAVRTSSDNNLFLTAKNAGTKTVFQLFLPYRA